MLTLYSPQMARKIVAENAALIENICAPYHLPSACLKAILLMEIPQIDLKDLIADVTVNLNWQRYSLTKRYSPDRHTRNPFRKFDSSTGFGQIFAQVAIDAILFAESMGLPVFLGISGELFPFRPEDVKRVWKRLKHDKVFNLSCSALNLLHAAFQMTGRIDFENYTDEELKLIFSRYNGNVRTISAYGEKAFQYYKENLESGF